MTGDRIHRRGRVSKRARQSDGHRRHAAAQRCLPPLLAGARVAATAVTGRRSAEEREQEQEQPGLQVRVRRKPEARWLRTAWAASTSGQKTHRAAVRRTCRRVPSAPGRRRKHSAGEARRRRSFSSGVDLCRLLLGFSLRPHAAEEVNEAAARLVERHAEKPDGAAD